ncbi:MAG: DUF4276 family protein [Acidobacteria bacterium]|nr:DUF4276 family protein [Acidobacteriota bacterium]
MQSVAGQFDNLAGSYREKVEGKECDPLQYFQLHEYEGLLFSDPAAFANAIKKPNLSERFQTVRNGFETPEDINDDPTTAPSKRVTEVYPSYRKPIDGTLAARAVGIEDDATRVPAFSGLA